jgi:hypothetical protein
MFIFDLCHSSTPQASIRLGLTHPPNLSSYVIKEEYFHTKIQIRIAIKLLQISMNYMK